MSAAGLSTKNAPSPMVVLPHYALGAIAFIIASILLFFAAGDLTTSYIGPKVLSIVHILILGWVTMIIFGALYQLIPVVMEIKLYSEGLAYASLVTLTIGVSMMTWGFWESYTAPTIIKHAGGGFLILSMLLFVYNVLMSAKRTANKTIENKFIVTSAFWLLATVLFGIFILFNVSYSWVSASSMDLLKVHVLMGMVGWFMLLIIGVASTLMPMFFIAHQLNKKCLERSYILVNIGLVAGLFLLYFFPNTAWISIFALPIFIGMAMFFKYNLSAYKKRLRKKLDIGMKLSVLAFIVFVVSVILGILTIIISDIYPIFSSKIYLAFSASLIFGFFTILILGQMYKTLPFIVWLQKYQDKVGKFTIPLPNDLYSEKVADAHYYTVIISIISLIIGLLISQEIIIQIAAGFFVLTGLLYAYNTFTIILHKENATPLKKPEFKK